ncbi:MAG: ABC transporter substrate-binding protein [Defluviitaleaceae bacterium]|nr:ABC transporter substrate-binding protein [Defluviitaleaceae bacterium]
MGIPLTLNPLLNTCYRVDRILRLIFEPLVILNADMRPIPNPAIVDDIVFAPDGRSITIVLRYGIFWEDYSPIVAADIAFSINILRNFTPAEGIYAGFAANISNTAVIDPRTIIISLHEHHGLAMYMLAFPIIPAAYFAQTSMAPFNHGGGRNMWPMGNGPFRLEAHSRAQYLRLAANENAAGGRPNINRINAIILRDYESEIHAFEQGIIDALNTTPAARGRYQDMRRGADFITNDFDFIGFNFARTMFMDLSMRQAIAHAIDTDYIIARAFHDAARAAAPINPASWLHNANPPRHDFDPARTEELFSRLGFVRNSEGMMERRILAEIPVPLRMSVLVNSENPEGMIIARHLVDNLRKSGADAILEAVDFAEYTRRINYGDFDIFVGGLSLSLVPDFSFAFHSSNIGHTNIFGYQSDAMDLLLYIIRTAQTDLALITAMHNLQNHIAENLPIYGIAFRQETLTLNPRIHGNFPVRVNDNFAGISSWFVPAASPR